MVSLDQCATGLLYNIPIHCSLGLMEIEWKRESGPLRYFRNSAVQSFHMTYLGQKDFITIIDIFIFTSNILWPQFCKTFFYQKHLALVSSFMAKNCVLTLMNDKWTWHTNYFYYSYSRMQYSVEFNALFSSF